MIFDRVEPLRESSSVRASVTICWNCGRFDEESARRVFLLALELLEAFAGAFFGDLLFCDDDAVDFFFIGEASLAFLVEGLADFVLLDVFFAGAMIG